MVIVAISAVFTLSVLLLLNRGVEWFAGKRHINTYQRDDMLEFVDEPLFALGKDGWYQTTPYAEQSIVRSRFRALKGNAWRVFMLGGSFMMGSPHTKEGAGGCQQGGIPSFLLADLKAMAPQRAIEVINAGAAAQNSNRVRLIAGQALEFSPDILVAAICNNEGALPPGIVTETLHRFAGVRLIRRLITPPVKLSERSYYTQQDSDTAGIREAFRANIRAILAKAAKKKVRVLLATLPVNLRYQGNDSGHMLPRYEDRGAPPDHPSPCLAKGVSLIKRGRTDEARSALGACEDAGALRELGLLEYNSGSYDEAYRLLKQYTELVPRNRCRPSFNEIIREEAASFPNARLLDLEKEAEALSPHGIPGQELFIDYCHMTWLGYKMMEEAVLKALEHENWLPTSAGKRPSLSREELLKIQDQYEASGCYTQRSPQVMP